MPPFELNKYIVEGTDPNNLSAQVTALVSQQRATCFQIGESYKLLDILQTRQLTVDRYNVLAQFNPRRFRNTASFDKQTVKSRSCFLDADHLLPGELGINWVIM